MKEMVNNWVVPVDKYIKKGYWKTLTLGQELEEWSTLYGDHVAIIDKNGPITFKELNDRVWEQAYALLSIGINCNDKILIQLPNRTTFIILLFALFRIGAIPVLTMPATRENEILALCKYSNAVGYVTTSHYQSIDYTTTINAIKNNDDNNVKYFFTDDGTIKNSINLKTFYSKNKVHFEPPSFKDIALLLISGGTTGTPKLIPRRHADYSYVARTCSQRCGMNSQSIYMAVLPVAHNFPLCCPGALGILGVGGSLILCETQSYDESFYLIEKYKVTHTALVPSLIKIWLEALEWEDADLSSLKLLQIGGAYLDPEIAKKICNKFGSCLQQVFGTAEGLICTTSINDDYNTIINTQGKPICIDDEIRIVDINDNDVENGKEGELLVRGPYTIGGYYNAYEANIKAITKDGYYRTGDIAKILDNGNIKICGRIKELINRNGEKISSEEIENILRTHKDIIDVAVVGVPDKEMGECIYAWIISNKKIDLLEIHDFLRENGFSRYKYPDKIGLIDKFPLTSVGKISKKTLIAKAINS